MVGVSSYDQSVGPQRSSAFLFGFVLGGLITTPLAALSVWLVVQTLVDLCGSAQFVLAFVFFPAAAILVLLDVAGRTPTLRRQTPQSYSHLLHEHRFMLGLVYGLDIGAVVSTIQISALFWVTILAASFVSFAATMSVAVCTHVALAIAIVLQVKTDSGVLAFRLPPRIASVHRSLRVGSAAFSMAAVLGAAFVA